MNIFKNIVNNAISGLTNAPVKTKIRAGYSLLALCALLLGGAIVTSFGYTDYLTVSSADNFAKTKGDTESCYLHMAVSNNRFGNANAGISFNAADLRGEQGKDWAKTVDSSYFSLNNSANRITAQRRNGKATEVAVAPGMNVQLNSHFLNQTGGPASVEEVNYIVNDIEKLVQPGTNTLPIVNKNYSVIWAGQTLKANANVVTAKTNISLPKDEMSAVGPSFTFQAIQPVTQPKTREYQFTVNGDKTAVKVLTTLQNNMNEVVNNIQVITPAVNGDIKTSTVSLNAKETKTVEQTFTIPTNSTAKLDSGTIKINQSFTTVIAKASPYTDEGGKISVNDIKQTPGFLTRSSDNNFKGTQWANVNQVNNLQVKIIPYVINANGAAVPQAPKPEVPVVVPPKPLTNDLELKKNIPSNDNNYKAGEEIKINNKITNKGQSTPTGFIFKDTLPACVDMSTLKIDYNKDALVLNSTKVDGNVVTYDFTVKGGFKPGASFDILTTVKTKTSCACTTLTNPGRVDMPNNGVETNMNNNSDQVDFKPKCDVPTPVVPVPTPKLDVTLTKEIVNNKPVFNQGDEIKFKLETKNISNVTPKGFTITDTLGSCLDVSKITLDSLEYDKTRLMNVTLVVSNDKLTFTADVKDGYKPNDSFSISYKTVIRQDCKCLEINSPARVNVEAPHSTTKEENFMSYDITKEKCKAGDNNCDAVKYTVACPAPVKTLDYAIVKSIVNPKPIYKEGEIVTFNNKITKCGDELSNQFRITDTLPKELDADTYTVVAPAGFAISNIVKIKNADGSATITYVVTSDKNLVGCTTLDIISSAKVKVGAKCTSPVSPIRVDTTNNQIETPATNVINGMCKLSANGASNTNNTNSACTPCPANANGAGADCGLKSCVTGDNNCSQVTFNLDCPLENPTVITPRPVTPRTGGLELSLAFSAVISMIIGVMLIASNKKGSYKIQL
jgi:uncharacterized repeat protein (TIGR01451 family)